MGTHGTAEPRGPESKRELPKGSVLRDADIARDRIASLVVDPPIPAEAEVLLLLHDIDGNALAWAPVARGLVTAGRAALAPDLRGRGASFGLGASSADRSVNHANDLVGLLDDFGVDRAIVVGHGWGSDVGRQLAEQAPERVCALVAIDPSVWQMAPQRLATPPADRDGLRRFWIDELAPSGCLEADAVAVADHDGEGPGQPLTIRVDLDIARRDGDLTQPTTGTTAWSGPVEIVRSAHDLSAGRAIARSHDVPLLDHNGVIMSPNGADVVLAAIERADRAVARLVG